MSSAMPMRCAEAGVLLVAFSLHDNVQDELIWKFFESAQIRGFETMTKTEAQLPPRCNNMSAKRTLVHCFCMQIKSRGP